MMGITIDYRRPPDRTQTYEASLIEDAPDFKVTLMTAHPEVLTIGGRLVAEPGSPILWFVFPGAWYDIGAFHLRDGKLTGYYTNFIRPPHFDGDRWRMDDLCLDLWQPASGGIEVLDRDDFDEAVERGYIDDASARRVEAEVARILVEAEAGRWPPTCVKEFKFGAGKLIDM